MENNACVLPACLPKKEPDFGTACHVAGFGVFNAGSTYPLPSKLQVAEINIFDREYCADHATISRRVHQNDYQSLDETEFCAGVPDIDGDGYIDGGSDACQGDSGGPLICNVDGRAVLTGIVAWGVKCGQKGSPGVYTDVNFLSDWVMNHSQGVAGMQSENDICQTCDETGFTYEEMLTYGNADSFIPYEIEIESYEYCAELCTDEKKCTAYTWDNSTGNNDCYLLRTIVVPATVTEGGVAGRRCSLVPECKSKLQF